MGRREGGERDRRVARGRALPLVADRRAPRLHGVRGSSADALLLRGLRRRLPAGERNAHRPDGARRRARGRGGGGEVSRAAVGRRNRDRGGGAVAAGEEASRGGALRRGGARAPRSLVRADRGRDRKSGVPVPSRRFRPYTLGSRRASAAGTARRPARSRPTPVGHRVRPRARERPAAVLAVVPPRRAAARLVGDSRSSRAGRRGRLPRLGRRVARDAARLAVPRGPPADPLRRDRPCGGRRRTAIRMASRSGARRVRRRARNRVRRLANRARRPGSPRHRGPRSVSRDEGSRLPRRRVPESNRPARHGVRVRRRAAPLVFRGEDDRRPRRNRPLRPDPHRAGRPRARAPARRFRRAMDPPRSRGLPRSRARPPGSSLPRRLFRRRGGGRRKTRRTTAPRGRGRARRASGCSCRRSAFRRA